MPVQRPGFTRSWSAISYPLGEVLVPRDEPVVVELDLGDEVARAVADQVVAERLVTLLRARHLQRRHVDERHDEIRRLVQPGKHRQRVEERRGRQVEVVRAVESDVEAQTADDLRAQPAGLELVAELVCDSDLRPLGHEPVEHLRAGDLHARLVEPAPHERPH